MISLATFLSIRALHEEGVAKKCIARRLGLNVRTVRAYLKKIEAGNDSAPTPTARRCQLDPHRERIALRVNDGCSAIQIHAELLSAHPEFHVGYETVKRLVRKLKATQPEAYCRMSFEPGEEAQIDFGEVGVVEVHGQRRRAWLFCLTLCYSRASYYELVLDQKVPTFLGAIRRGFESFGGAPARLKPDNLRSAVLFNSMGERYYQRDFFALCRHYGTLPDAARPRTPTDKGRVEREIRYVKGRLFRGRKTTSFEQAQADLERFRGDVAMQRTHGTTRKMPRELLDQERSHLNPLPAEPFEIATWGVHRVRKDCHIQIERNYYSVPHRLVGTRVEVKVSENEIVAYAEGQVVANHKRLRSVGSTATDPEHYPKEKRLATQEIHRRRVEAIRLAGPNAARFLSRLREGSFVLNDQLARFVRLLESYGANALDAACCRALHFEAVDSTTRLERILERGLERRPMVEPLSSKSARVGDFGRPLREYQMVLEGANHA